MNAPTRLLYSSLLMAALFLGGTTGYHVIEGASWWEAFYMTVITITTVGYGEVFPLTRGGEIFTVVLLLSGLGMFLLLATEVARTVVEGEIRQVFGRVRRTRVIDHMANHDVVCGYGRMGRAVVAELRQRGRGVVVVERGQERIRELQEAGIPVVSGDATSETTLRSARLDTARGLVACLNDDAHNVYTVLTARAMKPDLFIVARATEESAERRILKAGADRVVNPYNLGGTRLAHLVIKPAIVNFFDASLSGHDDLQLDQTSIRAGSSIAGHTLREANLRQQWGLGVVAVQRGAQVIANPPSDTRLEVGDVLVVFGSREQIATFEARCCGA